MERNPQRIEPFTGTVENLWKRAPQLRFGQFILNAFHGRTEAELYNMEDDAFLARIVEFYGKPPEFSG